MRQVTAKRAPTEADALGSNVEDDHKESKKQRASQQRHEIELPKENGDKGARLKGICGPATADRTKICEAHATDIVPKIKKGRRPKPTPLPGAGG